MKLLASLTLLLAVCSRIVNAQPPPSLPFLTGGDISLLTRLERAGAVYKDGGRPQDALAIFRAHGCNLMRLRIWVHPTGDDIFVNDTAYTVALGARIKKAGLKLLLDFHYSDSWADPGKQPKPAAWKDLPFPALVQQVRVYSRDVIAAMRQGGALPDMVQIGNEITNGMLWPDGQLTSGGWDNLAALIKAGIAGVKEGAAPERTPLIMIHIDRGGDAEETRRFIDAAIARGVDFDVIGESYYPRWHGPLAGLVKTLHDTALRYGKPIIVVETGYPYSGTRSGAAYAYPFTPEGQTQFTVDVVKAVKQTPNGLGAGVVWWEPEWISAPRLPGGWQWTLFDKDGNTLPALAALGGA